MNRILSPLLLLLFILSTLPADAQDGTPSSGGTWTITGTETCTDTLVVDRNITIESGGTLDLQGCTLRMASPPYTDEVFPQLDEGLVIKVNSGGSLRLHAADGRGSAIERADPLYGYTIKVFGHFESVGAPEAWNRIEGVEGAHQPSLGLGGMQIRQDATVRYTLFKGNLGPVPFVLNGATLDADQVRWENSSFTATKSLRVAVSNFTIDDPWGGPTMSTIADARLSDCSIRSDLAALNLAVENVTVRRCLIESTSTAVSVVNAGLRLENSTVRYGVTGLQFGVKGKFASSPNRLILADTTVQPLDGPKGVNATDAITAVQSQLILRNTTVVAGSGSAINATGGSFQLEGSHLRGSPAFRATDPWEGSTIPAAQLEGPQPRALVLRQTLVTVTGTDGQPLPNATVTVAGATATTDAQGRAPVTWTWAATDGVVIGPFSNDVPVSIVDPATGKTVDVMMPADRALFPVTLQERKAPSPLWLAFAAVALAAAVSRRFGR